MEPPTTDAAKALVKHPSMHATVEKLKPAAHQVGGHMTKAQAPESLIDDQGRFYKPYQVGPRAEREVEFYQRIAAVRNGTAQDATDKLSEDVQGLVPFLPGFYGTLECDERHYIVMDDLCKDYKHPCVLDTKMGFTTAYPWADQKLIDKNKKKDGETTQASLGYRISGMQSYHLPSAIMTKQDRNWGKTLDNDGAVKAFLTFCDNGVLKPQQLLEGEAGILAALERLASWFETQRSFVFYAASVLFTYEGSASSLEEAKLKVRFVDFAHTFKAPEGQRDDNVLSALRNMISKLRALLQEQAQQGPSSSV